MKDIADPVSSYPLRLKELTSAGNSLLFSIDDSGHSRELWSPSISALGCGCVAYMPRVGK